MQIHELNTFTEIPGGASFLAIDNGFDTGKISAGSFLSDTNAKIDALDSKKLNNPAIEGVPVYGDPGQLLRTLGDGRTEWTDVGLPTDEQTEEAVTNWLNDHPEATTTVQDNSLTTAKYRDDSVTEGKLSASVRVKLNGPFYDVTKYGIMPNTGSDLYEALFDFLHDVVASTGGIVYFPPGTYLVSDCVFIPANTIFMGAGAATVFKYTEEYNAMGVGLSNGGSNVGITNMTVDCNTSSEIDFGSMTGAIGFGTYTFASWDAYHKSPSAMAHADSVNLFAVDLWTNTRYILQTETGTNQGTVTGVLYKNIHAENSLVSIMGRDAITDVTIENVKCAFLRIGTDTTPNNVDVRAINVSTGRMFLRGTPVSVYESFVLPGLKYDSSTVYTYAVLLQGDVRLYNCYIDASQYLRAFSRQSSKVLMVGVTAENSTTQVFTNAVGPTDPNFSKTHLIGCRLETAGSSGSIVYGRIDSTYFPTLGPSSKIQRSPVGREAIDNGADFNDLKASGRYYGTGTVAASMANKPSDLGSTFFLDVESNSWAGDVNQAIAMQKITKLNGTAVYIRTCESGTWTSWYKYTGTAM